MNNRKIILLILTLCLSKVACSQNNNFTFNAQAGVYADFYQMHSSGGEVAPRRPDRLLRFMANGSFGFRGFNIPFNVLLTNNQQNLNVPLPVPVDQNIIDFITNPANSIGLSPKLKPGKVTLGTYVPRHGTFTSGVLRVFGLGGDFLIKDKWRIALHTGDSQIPVPESLFDGQNGAYRRRVTSFKMGYGKDDETHLHLLFMRANDRVKSIPDTLSTIPPQENIVIGLNYKYKFNQKFFVEGEFARSGITDNTLEEEVASDRWMLRRLLGINSSSRVGTAFQVATGMEGKVFSVKAVMDYVSQGFSSLGYPFLQPDQLNVTLNPRLVLRSARTTIDASIGRRVNNLQNIKQNRATQEIYNLNVSWQPTDAWSLNVTAGNFGFRNTVRNDTLRVENVSRSLALSSAYTLTSVALTHTWSGNISWEAFRDYNLISGADANNDAQSAMLSYTLGWKDKPMSLIASFAQFDNQSSAADLLMTTWTLGASRKILNKKASLSTNFNFAINKLNQGDPARQLMLRLQYQHSFLTKFRFSLDTSLNLYRFGEERPGVRYRETLLRTSLIYTL